MTDLKPPNAVFPSKASNLSGRDWMVAFLLAALCFCLRTAGADRMSLSADEGVVGLMGLDILSGKWPTCYWYGQEYMGTLENILAAPFIALFGTTPLAIRMPSVICSAAAVAMVYLYIARNHDRRPALAAALLLVFSPVFFQDITVRARGGYAVTLPLAAGLLLAAPLRSRLTFARGVACGLISGAAFWTNPQTLEVTLPLLLYVVVFRLSRRGIAGLAVGCFAGLLPVAVHFVSTGVFMQLPPHGPDSLVDVLLALPRRSVSVFSGPVTVPFPVRVASGLAVSLFLAAGTLCHVARRLRERSVRPIDALLLAPLFGAAVLAANGSIYMPQRYYYLIYFALVPISCLGWWNVVRPAWSVFAVVTVLAANFLGLSYHHRDDPLGEEYLQTTEYHEVISLLQREGIGAVVTDYGADYSLMYLSGLEVKALPVPLGSVWSTRYGEAVERVKSARDFAVVLYEQPAHERLKDHMKPSVFEEFLDQRGLQASISRLGRISVYSRIAGLPDAGALVEYGNWVLERYPHLRALTTQVNSEDLTVE